MNDNEFDSFKKEEIQSEKKAMIKTSLIIVVPSIVIILAVIWFDKEFGSNDSALGWCCALAWIPIIIAILVYIFRIQLKRIEKIESFKTKEEYDAWVSAVKKEETERRYQEIKRKNEIKAAQHPECPMCHGKNTCKIEALERAVSVGTMGLASSKIGKQFYCKDCRYYW